MRYARIKGELGERSSGDLGRHGAGNSATDSANHRVAEAAGRMSIRTVEPLSVPVAATVAPATGGYAVLRVVADLGNSRLKWGRLDRDRAAGRVDRLAA